MGTDLGGGVAGGLIVVDTDVAEVGPEPGLHLFAERGGERAAGAGENAMDGGALDVGLLGLLMAAARTVLMPLQLLFLLLNRWQGMGMAGELEHSEDCCVARGALEREHPGIVPRGRRTRER
ncbi:hypothetical protein [Streptomyces sp. NPDC055912]|uniref:hypothetical protein n=1 Tax=Streptomyces sp. NPDC055912 TaxID=3345660 RepID=UPI0035DBD723